MSWRWEINLKKLQYTLKMFCCNFDYTHFLVNRIKHTGPLVWSSSVLKIKVSKSVFLSVNVNMTEGLTVGVKQHIDQKTQCLWPHMLSIGPSQINPGFMCIGCCTLTLCLTRTHARTHTHRATGDALPLDWLWLGHRDTNEPWALSFNDHLTETAYSKAAYNYTGAVNFKGLMRVTLTLL